MSEQETPLLQSDTIQFEESTTTTTNNNNNHTNDDTNSDTNNSNNRNIHNHNLNTTLTPNPTNNSDSSNNLRIRSYSLDSLLAGGGGVLRRFLGVSSPTTNTTTTTTTNTTSPVTTGTNGGNNNRDRDTVTQSQQQQQQQTNKGDERRVNSLPLFTSEEDDYDETDDQSPRFYDTYSPPFLLPTEQSQTQTQTQMQTQTLSSSSSPPRHHRRPPTTVSVVSTTSTTTTTTNNRNTTTLPPTDMEYDERDDGPNPNINTAVHSTTTAAAAATTTATAEEEKYPTPTRTLSHASASVSSSITSSAAMIVVQEDGMCTYAYYDEDTWEDNVVGPLHHHQQQQHQQQHEQHEQQQQQQQQQQEPSYLHQPQEFQYPYDHRRRRALSDSPTQLNHQQQQRYSSSDDYHYLPDHHHHPDYHHYHVGGGGGGARGRDSSTKPFGLRRYNTTDSESSFSSPPHNHDRRGNGSSSHTGGGVGGGVGGGGNDSIAGSTSVDGCGDDSLVLLNGAPVESALNKQNVLNFMCLLGNLVVVGLVGVWKLNGRLKSVVEVWEEQQTLVSPAIWCLTIWPLILLLETIFAFAQLAPSFRTRPIVQEGTSYFFVHTCLGQMGWMLFFSSSMFLPAFLCILYALVSLSSLKLSQDFVLGMHRPHAGRTTNTAHSHGVVVSITGLLTKMKGAEYWFLRFPFQLHLGWTVVVASVTLVIFVVRCGVDGVVELVAALVVLSVWLLVAFFYVIVLSPGGGGALDFTIPLVIVWAYIGIGMSLRHPSPDINMRFEGDEIKGLSATSFALAILVAMLILPGVAYRIFREQFTINVSEVE